jgi:tRNA(fMet)-specific endonuclease VapC
MATLIDSSVLIAAERGQLNFDAIAAEEDVPISAVTASELLHGVHRARTLAQHHRRQAFVEGLMAQLPVIAFDLIVARVHTSLWAELAKHASNWFQRYPREMHNLQRSDATGHEYNRLPDERLPLRSGAWKPWAFENDVLSCSNRRNIKPLR